VEQHGQAPWEGAVSPSGGKSVFIKRVPLGNILAEEAQRQGITIMGGKKLQTIDVTSQGGVVATFQDGSSASADLLSGSDGVHSRTHRSVDPAFAGAVYPGLMNTGGYTSKVKVASPPEATHLIFGKHAFFGYHVSPEGYIYWFANSVRAEEPAREAEQVSACFEMMALVFV
jgi:2-polyprenyl-6-methoxyphenol hydroxylase-like FAD-dependent oxidoreductase